MTDHSTGETDGIVLLGSEMLTWSDAAGNRGAFGGRLAPYLLGEHGNGTGRVLIAGPTTAEVIAGFAGSFDVDVLVRSWPDAQALRAALPTEVRLFCGPLDRFAEEARRRDGSYDVVVAVAGLDRLHSAEEDTPTTADVLSALAGLVAQGGELVVGVGNDAGVDRLLALSHDARHGDADWPDGHVSDQLSPGPGEVAEALQALGLDLAATWYCHGRRAEPLLAATADLLKTRAHDPVVLREVTRAYDLVDRAEPPLKDPVETVHALVRAGLGAEVAPTAILHLRRGLRDGAAPGPVPAAAALICEPAHDGAPAVVYQLLPGDGWTRQLLTDADPVAITPAITRHPDRLNGRVPAGETLAALLERCVAAHDLSTAGDLVRRYREALAPESGEQVPAERVPYLPRTLAVTGDDLVAIDPGWIASGPEHADVVLVRGLLDLAADLLGRGVRHPWSPAVTARSVAASLATAADIDDPARVLDAALALDARLRPEGTAPDFDAPANLGRLPYAELLELVDQLGERAAQADEHIVWLLKRMQVRQRALRAARGQINGLEASREMWIGRRVLFVRSLIRRRRRRKEAAGVVPEGQWTGGGRNPDLDESKIEAELVPRGWTPVGDIEVVPTADPPIDPSLDPRADPD